MLSLGSSQFSAGARTPRELRARVSPDLDVGRRSLRSEIRLTQTPLTAKSESGLPRYRSAFSIAGGLFKIRSGFAPTRPEDPSAPRLVERPIERRPPMSS